MRRIRVKIAYVLLATFWVGVIYIAIISVTGITPTAMFPQERLAWAKARWEDSNIQSYRMQIRIFRPPFPFLCEYSTTATNNMFTNTEGRAVGIFEDHGEWSEFDTYCDDGTAVTVDALFQLVEKSHITHLVFSSTGYVSEVTIDTCGCPPNCGIGDCNVTYRVTNFEILKDP